MESPGSASLNPGAGALAFSNSLQKTAYFSTYTAVAVINQGVHYGCLPIPRLFCGFSSLNDSSAENTQLYATVRKCHRNSHRVFSILLKTSTST